MKLNQEELTKLATYQYGLYTPDNLVGYWVDPMGVGSNGSPERYLITKCLLWRDELKILSQVSIQANDGKVKTNHGDGRDAADFLFKEFLRIDPQKTEALFC